MKVLHIFYEINYSGAEIMYINAAPIFKKEGFELHALSSGLSLGSLSNQYEEAGFTLHHYPLLNGTKNPFSLVGYLWRLTYFIRKQEFDVIHIHRANFCWLFTLASFFAGRRSIRTIHNVFRNKGLGWVKAFIERGILRKIFGLKYQSIGTSVESHEREYFYNKTYLVNNWFNEFTFKPLKDRQEFLDLRKTLGLDLDAFIVISTGSCSVQKNHCDIIRALEIINRNFKCIYLHLGCGEELDNELDLAKRLGILEQVMYVGNKSNVRDYLAVSNVYVMPSHYEGLSIAAIEAMACGLPSVLYNSDGLRDLILNDDNGYLIDNDFTKIAEAVVALKNSPEQTARMGNSALEFVNQNFSLTNGVSKIIGLYKLL